MPQEVYSQAAIVPETGYKERGLMTTVLLYWGGLRKPVMAEAERSRLFWVLGWALVSPYKSSGGSHP